MTSLTAIILAAGKSTRMKSRKPKVLHELCGRPMIEYVVAACYEAGVTRILMVVGHEKDQLIAHFAADKHIRPVEQVEQHGTGHAALACADQLKGHSGDVMILAGDGPLVRGQVLETLLGAHRAEHAAASMATALLDDPTGYGRVVRDEKGGFLRIVEETECTPEQRRIKEIFPSYYCVKSDELLWALPRIKNDNKKGEYYLTDIFGILRSAGKKVLAVQAVAAEEVLGINTGQQLADADAVMQDRIQRRHREQGVVIVSSVNTYVEDGVTVGADTVIQPFVFIGRGSTIGADCVIGPMAHLPRQTIVPEAAAVAGGTIAEAALKA